MKMKNIKKNLLKNIKKITEDKTLIILIALLVVLALVILILKLTTINHLDTESELVTEIHNYFNSKDLASCDGLFNYSDKKTEYKDIDSELKLCIAYQKAKIKDSETETIKATKKKETCTKDGMIFRVNEDTDECTYSKIDRKIIDDSYKKLFGKEIENNESFKSDNLNICYLKDDYYYCGLSEMFTYTLGNESIIYRVMEKAVEKRSEIIIYDYFAKINDNTCYKNYTTMTINNDCTKNYKGDKDINYKFMKKYGTYYKHVFKKAENDTYYWVSSEPIK